MRLQSKPGSDPLTGAMLGMGGDERPSSALAGQMDPKAAQANAQQQMQSGSTEPPGRDPQLSVRAPARARARQTE